MVGLFEARDADRSGGGFFQMIEIEAQIVDRYLGGLVRLVRGCNFRRTSAANIGRPQCRGLGVGESVKFIISDSTVGSSRAGISRVGDSSAPRSGLSKVKSRSDPACSRPVASPVAAE